MTHVTSHHTVLHFLSLRLFQPFYNRVLAAGAQPNIAADDGNAKSFDKVLVKTLAKATSAYPPAMAEIVTFMVGASSEQSVDAAMGAFTKQESPCGIAMGDITSHSTV